MAIFERSLFNKSISATEQDIASGTSAVVFRIPWNKLGYLKRIEANNPSAGVMDLQIYDNYKDDVTGASGYTKRKDIHIPANVEQINWDEDEDIPLIGEVSVISGVSGVDVTMAARLV